MKRTIAIICWNDVEINEIENNIISHFTDDNITIFSRHALENNEKYNNIIFPNDIDLEPKAKNYVFEFFRKQEDIEFLHVIENTVKILKNPNEFINKIEYLMTVLDLNSYFGTTTDVCNRVYNKYNPRLEIKIDYDEFKKLNLDTILFCSHANTQWIIVNIKKADDNELFFNTQFSIPMYWIIEFLARRRNTHSGSLYYMNQYITCLEEQNLYINIVKNSSDEVSNSSKFKEEDELFKSLNVKYDSDNNIDKILEDVYLKLKSKI